MAEHEPCIGASDDWERIRDLLDYDPMSGVFRWRCNISNLRAGTPTGSRTHKGYLLIRVDKRAYLAHRLAWFWMTGAWPDRHVDHKNLVKDDNRWSNLRLATNSENHLNRPKNKNNTSGFKGVSFDKSVGRYAANLSVDGRRRFLGYHDTPQDAHLAYARAIERANPEFGRSV